MTQEVRTDSRLMSGLELQFNDLRFRSEIGNCLIYSGERKVDGCRYDLYLPKSQLLEGADRIKALSTAFQSVAKAGARNLQGQIPLSDTVFPVGHQRVSVLGMVASPIAMLDASIDGMSIAEKKAVFMDALHGLAALHDAGLTHGNLSDRTVRRETDTGPLKLCDLAFSLGGRISITEQPLMYQSADILADGKPSFVADLHAAGLLGYRLFLGELGPTRALTGRRDPLPDSILRQHITSGGAPILSAADLSPEQPDEMEFLAPVLARMIGHGPVPYTNAASVLQALSGGGYEQSNAEAFSSTPTEDIQIVPPEGPKLPISFVVSLAVVVVLAGFGYYYYRNWTADQEFAEETARLTEIYESCSVKLSLPDGKLSSLQDQNLVHLRNQLQQRNETALRVLCDIPENLMALAPLWERALLVENNTKGFFDAAARENLRIPDTSATQLRESLTDLSMAKDTLNPQVPEVFQRAVESAEDHFRTFEATLRATEIKTISALSKEFISLGLPTDPVDALLDQIVDATGLSDFVGLMAGSTSLREEQLTGLAQAWQVQAAETEAVIKSRLEGLPLTEAQVADKLENVHSLQSGIDDLSSDILQNSGEALRAWDTIQAELASLLTASEALAYRNQTAILASLVDTAEIALAPDLSLLTATMASHPASDVSPQGAELDAALSEIDTTLGTLTEAIARIEAEANDAEEAAAEAEELAIHSEVEDVTLFETVADTFEAAKTAQQNEAWGQAKELWLSAAQNLLEAKAAVEATATKAREVAVAARQAAVEKGADLSAGDAALSEGKVAMEELRYRTAAAAFYRSASAFEDEVLDIARSFDVGIGPEDAAALTALCQAHSRVPGRCTKENPKSESLREVRLTPFSLDATEVSVNHFAAFVRAQNYKTDAERLGFAVAFFSGGPGKVTGATWRTPLGPGSDAIGDEPVTGLSLRDAQAYCAFAGGRLPKAEEWEIVARGVEMWLFPWGDNWDAQAAVWQGNGGHRQPVSAGIKGPVGHFGLAGNVREWAMTDAGAVLKGGSWMSVNPVELAATTVMQMDGDTPGVDFGVRCARDLDTWN